jgi:hypothetical protein
MTVVPLPDTPCVRARLIYTQSDGLEGGNRFYFSYTGSAPSGATCTGLADTIAGEWNDHLAPLVNTDWSLTEVDVLDIATDSGLSGQWTGSNAGTFDGTAMPAQCATNIEFDIARRYRGGKPRGFLPPPAITALSNPSQFTTSFVDGVNTAFAAFVTAVLGYSEGGMTLDEHVNLSYYKGFTNITNSSGRERAVPTYRAVALSDPILGYATKVVVGSQKRRRTATSP